MAFAFELMIVGGIMFVAGLVHFEAVLLCYVIRDDGTSGSGVGEDCNEMRHV